MKYEVLGERVLPKMQDLHKRIPRLTAAVLSTTDGFNVCAIGLAEEQVGKLAAMSGSLLSMGASMVAELNVRAADGDAEYLTVKAGGYLLFSTRVNVGKQELALTVCAEDSSALGAIMVGVRYVADEIVALVDGESLEGDFDAVAPTPEDAKIANDAAAATATTPTRDAAATAATATVTADTQQPASTSFAARTGLSSPPTTTTAFTQAENDADADADDADADEAESSSVGSRSTTAGWTTTADAHDVASPMSSETAQDDAARSSAARSSADRSPALGAAGVFSGQPSTPDRHAAVTRGVGSGVDAGVQTSLQADDKTAVAAVETAIKSPTTAERAGHEAQRFDTATGASATGASATAEHGYSRDDSATASDTGSDVAAGGVQAGDARAGDASALQSSTWSAPTPATTDTTGTTGTTGTTASAAAEQTGPTPQPAPFGGDKPELPTSAAAGGDSNGGERDNSDSTDNTSDNGRIDTRGAASAGIRSTLDWWRRRDREHGK